MNFLWIRIIEMVLRLCVLCRFLFPNLIRIPSQNSFKIADTLVNFY